MLSHSRSRTSLLTGSRWLYRGASLILGALLLVIVLCAVAHGPTEEAHRPTSAVVTAAPAASHGTGQHAPHHPHGAEECADDAVVRTATPPPEQSLAAADVPAEVIAGLLVLRQPLALRVRHRRVRVRTGRAVLGRTSRWRI